MKNIIILGASGSIGMQTIDVIRNNRDKFKLIAFSVGYNINTAKEIIEEFEPKCISVIKEEDAKELSSFYKDKIIYYGDEGLIKVSTYKKEEEAILLNSLVGSVGLLPTIEAIKIKRDIAIANKETLVTAGHIVTKLAKENNVKLLPVDSEHSAIFQCINGENKKDINKLIITASGGSFRDKKREELSNVTVKDALNHPNWSMGSKITIDSATMMNKGFEVIEAKWLFDIEYENIETILHKESVIHSMVEFSDKSVIAQLGTPDMRLPIQYALTYPNRLPLNSEILSLSKFKTLNFKEMSFKRYPCLKMAYDAGKKGGIAPTILNAANEAAVNLFLNNKIKFLDIEKIIKEELDNMNFIENPTLDDVINVDKEIKEKIIKKFKGEI